MADASLYQNVQLLLRWFHVLAGITWIGHLYFFNFVNVPFQATIGADVKKVVNPQLMPRALWWFRWGAMMTFLFGLLLFTQLYMYQGGGHFGPTALLMVNGVMTGRSWWILLGMVLGFIMWFNVWFIIWPAQKKIIGGVISGTPADPSIPKRAGMFSRINTYLSGPMLFGMLGATHYSAMNWVTFIVVLLVGAGATFHAVKFAPKVGKTI
jgi:uncharacterized membrane protein